MQLPLEITYRDVEKTDVIDDRLRRLADKLDRYNDHISSCRIAVEKPHRRSETDFGYRVRLDLTVPPKHELAVVKESSPGETNGNLITLIDEAFDAAGRRLRKLAELQREEVKVHPAEEVQGFVTKLFDDHGFLRSPGTDEDIYFHRNSVVGIDFDKLQVSMPVAFTESGEGEEGPQASTVRIPAEAWIKPHHR